MSVQRQIFKQMEFYMGKYPILALTGPRQSGKTTLLKNMFSDFTYLSLENPDTRQYAETDPNGFLAEHNDKVILDEVQRAPHLFSYLQGIVDHSGKMGQFILSGSQNFHFLQNITQSLAGRVALFKLLPFDFSELMAANLLSDDYAESLIKGFYPAIYDRDIPPKVFYSNYIQTYVERDINEVLNVRDMKLFRNFVSLCATRAGQLLNLNALANECGITQPTAKAWLSVLESSYIVFLLHPHHKNYSKRLVKTPKLYFYDTGLLSYLLKITNPSKLKLDAQKGALFENMIVAEKLKQNYHNYKQQDMWFWRDSSGREIDLIIHEEEKPDIYEIKSTETVTTKLFDGLNFFESLAKDDIKEKILVYAGHENQNRSYAKVKGWQNC
jgi:predicted AAA+ superfamily ATPase